MIRQKLEEARMVGKDIYGPRFDLRENSWMKVFDLVSHN